MSLEQALQEHAAALKDNTAAHLEVAELLRQSNAGREAALARLTEEGAGKGTGRPPKNKGATAAAAPVSPPPPPPEPEIAGKATVDELRAAAVAFMSIGPDGKPFAADSPLKAPRKAFLKEVTTHLGVDQVTQAEEDDRAKVIDWFEAAARGEKVNFSDGEDDHPAAADDDDIG